MNNNNPFPQRKRQRLVDYDYSRAGSYYVTVCTMDRECIFWTGRMTDIAAGDKILSVPVAELSEYGRIAETAVKKIHGIDRYVVMPNHIHMIVTFRTSGEYDLRKEMRTFKSQVTRVIGKPVWERGYFDRVIRGHDEYVKYSDYIGDNPINWITDEYNKTGRAEM